MRIWVGCHDYRKAVGEMVSNAREGQVRISLESEEEEEMR